MRALEIAGPDAYGLVERPRPRADHDDVLLAPIAVGLCGTDIELLHGTMVYLRDGRAKLPVVPGHEWVAEVIEVGPEVADLAPGDRVVGECSIGCGHCDRCLAGNYHQCLARRETGVLGQSGALAEFMVMPRRALHVVPEGVADEDAALTEPLAVALRAVIRSGFTGGTARVTGGGTIGWLITAVLRQLHDADVAVSEPNPDRLDRLTQLGARLPKPGERFGTVFEASGTRAGLDDAVAALDDGGRLVVVGLTGGARLNLDVDTLVTADHEIVGSLGSPGIWPQALELLASGAIRPSRLISDRFELGDVDQALARLIAGSVGKIIVRPNAGR
jgi:threonine dehydrogenase-like Zn-dependent dehydrogenase